MPTTMHGTTKSPAVASPDSTGGAEAKPTTRGRPPQVENVTRVMVAFPFSTIRTTEPDMTYAVHQLAELVTALAAELDASSATPGTAALVERARTLAKSVPAG